MSKHQRILSLLPFFLTFYFFSNPSKAMRSSRNEPVHAKISSGRSGVLLDFGIHYGQSEATADPSPGNEWKNISSVYDLKLGYISDSDIYLGAGYSVRTDSLSSQANNSLSGGAVLLGAGWFWGSGFNLRGFYHWNESWGDYKSGTGFQADLGYMMNITSNFYMGLLFSHRQTTFTSNSTIFNFQSWTRKETFPILTFGFLIN